MKTTSFTKSLLSENISKKARKYQKTVPIWFAFFNVLKQLQVQVQVETFRSFDQDGSRWLKTHHDFNKILKSYNLEKFFSFSKI